MTASGRWFSILREDDSDYLSSRWLAQDCEDLEKGKRKKKKGRSTKKDAPEKGDKTKKKDKRKPNLDKYLEHQIKSLQKTLDQMRLGTCFISHCLDVHHLIRWSVPVQHPKRDSKLEAGPSSPHAQGPIVEEDRSDRQNPAAKSGMCSRHFVSHRNN